MTTENEKRGERDSVEAQPVAEVMGTEVEKYIGVTHLINWSKMPIGTKLFTAPPSSQALVAAALRMAADACEKFFDDKESNERTRNLCAAIDKETKHDD